MSSQVMVLLSDPLPDVVRMAVRTLGRDSGRST